jgi:hypothetical protein
MELRPITSSSGRKYSIGYEMDLKLLRVRYEDGSLYDHPNVSANQYAHIMGAASIGRALHDLARTNPPTKITGEVMPSDGPTREHNSHRSSVVPGGVNEPPAPPVPFEQEVAREKKRREKPPVDCSFAVVDRR